MLVLFLISTLLIFPPVETIPSHLLFHSLEETEDHHQTNNCREKNREIPGKMGDTPEESSPLKNSYLQSGNKAQGYREEDSYQGHKQNQNQQQQFSAGIFPEKHHLQDSSKQSNQEKSSVKVPAQPSAHWVSPKQDDCFINHHPKAISEQTDQELTPVKVPPQRQQLHLPPKNNHPGPSSQSSYQEPQKNSASSNISFGDFLVLDEQEERKFSSSDPKTGFPTSWPKVSPPPAKVASPPVEQPLPEKVLSPPPDNAYPQSLPRTVPPPSPPPPSTGPCRCCIIL